MVRGPSCPVLLAPPMSRGTAKHDTRKYNAMPPKHTNPHVRDASEYAEQVRFVEVAAECLRYIAVPTNKFDAARSEDNLYGIIAAARAALIALKGEA